MATAIIKHRRFRSATDRAAYLHEEKKRGRKVKGADSLNYVLADKPGQNNSNRVKKYWGSGVVLTGNPVLDAIELMRPPVLVEGRAEIFELLVSVQPSGNRADDDRLAVALTERLMAEFFPTVRWVAALHGDRQHSHVHIICPNDNGRGRSIQISRKRFLAMRRDLAKWSRIKVESAWGKGKKIEKRFSALSRQQMAAEIQAGRLYVHKRTSAGEIDELRWRPNDPKNDYEKIIRFWVVAHLESGLSYGVAELEMEISIFHKKQDALKLAIARLRKERDLVPAVQADRQHAEHTNASIDAGTPLKVRMR